MQGTEPSWEQLSDMIGNIPDYLSYTNEEKTLLPEVERLQQRLIATMNRYTSNQMRHNTRHTFYDISRKEFDILSRKYTVKKGTNKRFWRGQYHLNDALKIRITKKQHEDMYPDWPWTIQYQTNIDGYIRTYRLTVTWIKIMYDINFNEMDLTWNFKVEQYVLNPWDNTRNWEEVY